MSFGAFVLLLLGVGMALVIALGLSIVAMQP